MRVAVTLSLARKLIASRSLGRSTVLMTAAAAMIIGMFITLSAFTLSGEQVVDRDLGRFSTYADLGALAALAPGERGSVPDLAAAAAEAGARDVNVALRSFDVRPDGLDGVVIYREQDWAAEPFPDRYSLVQGRWPAAPGEVVVTEALRERTGSVDSLSIFSGNERLRVVGVGHDRFGAALRLLAAPGTWEGFGAAVGRNFATVRATPVLYWNGGDQRRVTDAIAAAASNTEGAADRSSLAAQVSAATITRELELARGRTPWTERLPIAYAIPSLALPLLSVLTVFGLNGRRFRRTIGVLRSVGVSRAGSTAGVALATGAWVLIATGLGVVAGIAAGAVSRPIIQLFLTQPVSPFPSLGSPVLRLMAVTAASCVLAAIILHSAVGRRDSTQGQPVRRTGTRPAGGHRLTIWSTARRAVAVVAGCAVVGQVATLDTVPEAMILAGSVGVLLLSFTPELVGLVVRSLPTGEPRVRLGRQQLINDQERAVAAVAVLAVVLGAPLGLLTLLATLVTTAEQQELPSVAPGQIVLAGPGGEVFPPAPEIVSAVAGAVSFDQPGIQLGYLRTEDTRVTVQGAGSGEVLAVATVEELARLNNGPLDDAAVDVLRRGGVLVWHEITDPHAVLIHSDIETEEILISSEPVPALRGDLHPVWSSTVAGVVLTRSADRLELPVTDGAIVFTGVSAAQAVAAEQAVLAAGLDTRQIDADDAVDPVRVPPVFYTAVAGLGLIVLLTTMAVARTQVATLRGYLGRLISIGLSPRWARQVLLIQSAVVVGLSTGLGLLLALPPVAVAASRLPDFTLAVPWGWLGLTVGTFYAAAAVATLLSSRRLRPVDRLTG